MRMFRAIAFLCFLGCVASSAKSQPKAPAQVLTNEGVVRLVRSGLSPDLIVTMIRGEPSKFTLNTDNVIRLKQQGVPDSVLAAMLAKKNGKASELDSKSSDSSPNSAKDILFKSSKTPNYTWELQNETDVMSGRNGFFAFLSTPAVTQNNNRVGDFEVTARCNSATTALKIVFLSNEKPPVAYKQNNEGLTIIGDGIFDAMRFAHMHKRPWTETRVRFDDSRLITVTSEKDYTNESEVYFQAQQNMPTNFLDAFGIALSSIGPNQPAGLEQLLFGSEKVLIESTFDNGTSAIIEIHPQDGVFQAFATRCKALIPLPPPPPAIVHTVPQIPVDSRLVFALDQTLDVKGVLAGKPVLARLTEPLHAPSDAKVTVYDIPAGTQVVLTPSFMGVTANQIKHSLPSQNLTPMVRLEIDHLILNGASLRLKTYPLDRSTLMYTEPYVPPPPPNPNDRYYHASAKLPGVADGKKSIVARAGERLETKVSENLIPSEK